MSETERETYTRLGDVEEGWVNVASAGDGETVQLQLSSSRSGLQLCNLSPAEAHRVAMALLKHGSGNKLWECANA